MEHRLIVAQPAWGEPGTGALAVGVMRYLATHEGRTQSHLGLVVKVSLAYSEGPNGRAEARIVAAEPLSGDVPSELAGAGEKELRYPSDFVPRKAEADVVVVGHAYAERPSARIYGSISMGALERGFSVAAAAPVAELPVTGDYLEAGEGGEPIGPLVSRPTSGYYPPRFDWSEFSCAAPSQRVRAIDPGAPIRLSGFSARAPGEIVTVALPDFAPAIVVARRGGGDTRVPLACDTLWIDADAGHIVLVYRGVLPVESFQDIQRIERIDAWIEPRSAPREIEDVRGELMRGVFGWAPEESDLEHGLPEMPKERLAMARYALLTRTPAPSMPLERYVLISAKLMEKREDRAATLARHGLDEDRWLIEERAWLGAMGDAAMRGEPGLAEEYGVRLLEAQDALAGPHEASFGAPRYAAIAAAMDRGADPTAVLAHHGMTLPEWMRLDRRMTRAAANDAALAADIARAVAGASVPPELLDDTRGFPSADDDEDDEDEA